MIYLLGTRRLNAYAWNIILPRLRTMCGLTPKNGFFPNLDGASHGISCLPLPFPSTYAPSLFVTFAQTISFIPRHRPNVFVFQRTVCIFSHVLHQCHCGPCALHRTTVIPTTIKVRFKNINNLLTTDMPIEHNRPIMLGSRIIFHNF